MTRVRENAAKTLGHGNSWRSHRFLRWSQQKKTKTRDEQCRSRKFLQVESAKIEKLHDAHATKNVVNMCVCDPVSGVMHFCRQRQQKTRRRLGESCILVWGRQQKSHVSHDAGETKNIGRIRGWWGSHIFTINPIMVAWTSFICFITFSFKLHWDTYPEIWVEGKYNKTEFPSEGFPVKMYVIKTANKSQP